MKKENDSSLDYLDEDWETDSDEESDDDYPYLEFRWDEDDNELGAHDAAWIWASNGKDEDYNFGYSDDELEESM